MRADNEVFPDRSRGWRRAGIRLLRPGDRRGSGQRTGGKDAGAQQCAAAGGRGLDAHARLTPLDRPRCRPDGLSRTGFHAMKAMHEPST
jgi:hypothetical protein